MKLDLKEWIKKIMLAGLVPDYANFVSISALPYTAPNHGIIIYIVGDGSVAGERDLIINGQEVGRFRTPVNGGKGTITALVSKGDIVSGTYNIWGTMKFYPYKLGG